MSAQVTFTADEKLKEKALEKAKQEGITLKSLFVFSMKSFVEGKIKVGLLRSEDSDVEEIIFHDRELEEKAKKLEKLLG